MRRNRTVPVPLTGATMSKFWPPADRLRPRVAPLPWTLSACKTLSNTAPSGITSIFATSPSNQYLVSPGASVTRAVSDKSHVTFGGSIPVNDDHGDSLIVCTATTDAVPVVVVSASTVVAGGIEVTAPVISARAPTATNVTVHPSESDPATVTPPAAITDASALSAVARSAAEML